MWVKLTLDQVQSHRWCKRDERKKSLGNKLAGRPGGGKRGENVPEGRN
jgi:hypothetical protein